MKFNRNTALWALIGSILIAALPFLLELMGFASLFARPPIFHLSLTLLSVVFLGTGNLYLLLLPLPFLFTLYVSGRKPNYARFILFSVLFFAALNAFYFFTALADAYVPAHAYSLKIALWENFIGFGLALGSAIFAVVKKSRNAAHFANMTLFITLAWFAFPYFGTYP